jgi:hypothetical protein
MHTLVFYAFHVDAVEQRKKQQDNDLVIAHQEDHPYSYILFPCDPETRAVDLHADPLPPMTFVEYKELSDLEQRSIRVMYSNHVETLSLVTRAENTRNNLTCAPECYQIHHSQLELWKRVHRTRFNKK